MRKNQANQKGDKPTAHESFITDVHRWNVRFPIDRWWREKYKIPYGSKAHLEACFIDMLFDYVEDHIYLKERLKFHDKKDDKGYIRGSLNYFRKIEVSEEDITLAYDNIDLSKY